MGKPNNWNKLSKEEKKEIALNLFESIRGKYVISQAFSYAINELKKEENPQFSNIEDMEILKEVLFNIPNKKDLDFRTIKKEIKNGNSN